MKFRIAEVNDPTSFWTTMDGPVTFDSSLEASKYMLDRGIEKYWQVQPFAEAVEGRKDDDGKERFDLFPPSVHLEIVKSLTHGAKKYGDENWKKVARRRYVGAFFRHVNKWLRGEKIDAEQGVHHLACACASLIFLIARDIGFDPEIEP